MVKFFLILDIKILKLINEAVELIYKLGEGFSENKKGQISNKTDLSSLVGLPGFEPRQTESKSVVLPLHHNPITSLLTLRIWSAKIRFQAFSAKRIFSLFVLK